MISDHLECSLRFVFSCVERMQIDSDLQHRHLSEMNITNFSMKIHIFGHFIDRVRQSAVLCTICKNILLRINHSQSTDTCDDYRNQFWPNERRSLNSWLTCCIIESFSWSFYFYRLFSHSTFMQLMIVSTPKFTWLFCFLLWTKEELQAKICLFFAQFVFMNVECWIHLNEWKKAY